MEPSCFSSNITTSITQRELEPNSEAAKSNEKRNNQRCLQYDALQGIEGTSTLSQDMMYNQSKIWRLCITTINYIQQLVCKRDGAFALNRSQCIHLAQTLEQTTKNIIDIFPHDNELLYNFGFLLKDLFCIIEKAKLLVEQCYGEKWWHAALLQINNEEAFQDLFMDLDCCYDDIFEHSKSQWGGQKLDQCKNGVSVSLPTRRKLVEDDHYALMRQLQATLKSTQSSPANKGLDEDLRIAEYLLMRYYNQTKHVNGGHAVEVDAEVGWGFATAIAVGAYGIVEKTTWFGLSCARKVQVLGSNEDEDQIFKREVAILGSVNHPNVVKLICCGRELEKFKCFIAMELLDTSLENLIKELSIDGRRPSFPIQVAVDIILQIAKGMSYLHEKNIAHRDLKPQNILVHRFMVEELQKDNYVNVKLADFGLSKMNVNGNISEELSKGLGTRLYKAPEFFQRVKHNTKHTVYTTLAQRDKVNAYEADVYSFGVTCARVLSGRQPFDGDDHDLLAKLKSGKRPWVPNYYPHALVSLINECWSLERTKRPKFKKICTTLKELRTSILKGNVALENEQVQKRTSMFQRIVSLPNDVIYLYKHFWKKPNLEARGIIETEHTHGIPVKSLELSALLSWATPILPSEVRSIHSLPSLPIDFVNIDERVSKVLFQLQSNQILGIIGMGGSGKTTLTKAILLRVHQGFEATSFVANMKGSYNVLDIQRQLLKDLKYERFISNTEQGFKCLQEIFERKKVFVVFDDVASQEQLYALVSPTWVFANGSKIIATSRNWQDLKTTCISHTGKMDMEFFDKEQAKELFYKHAFSQQQLPGPQFEEVVNKIIEACCGLPLSLVILGNYLGGVQRLCVWEQALQRLQHAQCLNGSWDNKRKCGMLRISYDSLDEEDKNMFLDIACFFCRDVLNEGMQEQKALKIWNNNI